MTREEVIDGLKVVRTIHNGNYAPQIDEAIKLLEQEPCEDAVSRQDVLDLVKKGILISNVNYKSVCKAINELPSVQTMPKKNKEYKEKYS